MALSAYMSLTGARQGPIEGSVTEVGREGMIEIIAVSHTIVAPRDPLSGRPKGKRMHKPMRVTKPVDISSPYLHFVLTQGEHLSDVTIRFFRPSPNGTEREAFIVRLFNASICNISTRLFETRSKRYVDCPPVEEVGFAYQRIGWTWTEGGIAAEDDWDVGRVVATRR